ncbi:hypothetical protein D0Z07_5082 [Hyphodiscus hymeniophilus]|uniref:Uncharacterized protein n=1 Tax=Hyphodiscus hymeniophilus TaxID=353542 RepID=A0A9P7AX17_9HELO|nr:hypothetical protein D0Z07_5082 [Hyphodiscus hymeniophilus]
MATPPSQPPNPPSSTGMDDSSRAKLVHNVSLAALVVCPLVIALPPRKLDIYTGLLLTGTFLGGNQLAYEYTGRSFMARCRARLQAVQNLSMGDAALPAKAKVMRERLRVEREKRERALGDLGGVELGKDKAEDIKEKNEEVVTEKKEHRSNITEK